MPRLSDIFSNRNAKHQFPSLTISSLICQCCSSGQSETLVLRHFCLRAVSFDMAGQLLSSGRTLHLNDMLHSLHQEKNITYSDDNNKKFTEQSSWLDCNALEVLTNYTVDHNQPPNAYLKFFLNSIDSNIVVIIYTLYLNGCRFFRASKQSLDLTDVPPNSPNSTISFPTWMLSCMVIWSKEIELSSRILLSPCFSCLLNAAPFSPLPQVVFSCRNNGCFSRCSCKNNAQFLFRVRTIQSKLSLQEDSNGTPCYLSSTGYVWDCCWRRTVWQLWK